MSYKHLTLEESYYIEIARKKGRSLKKIAKTLERSQSTISREIARNTGQQGYRYKQANGFAQVRHTEKIKAIKMTESVKAIINHCLEQQWSPEQITGRLNKEKVVTLHHESIYQYIRKDKQAGGCNGLIIMIRSQGFLAKLKCCFRKS